MKTIKFKCTLLSDIVISQDSATEGNKKTLDFIPGNNFLGVSASKLYSKLSNEDSSLAYHSGKVVFGDAHPLLKDTRTLKIPASFYYDKLSNIYESTYIHHNYDRNVDKANSNGNPMQLKQARSGFYSFKENKAYEAKISKGFAIKSAYDREKRRSKDECMYGYESIDKGLEFCFELAYDETISDAIISEIVDSLVGVRRVGRSKTAQYGLVNIEKFDYNESSSKGCDSSSLNIVYAESRLMFLDENNELIYRPSISDLGFESGEIDWTKSQIRTFQYSPWNSIRRSRDIDRIGIEKGSVFVIKNGKLKTDENHYVGVYNNEGFGKVIYNPEFIKSKEGENGKSIITFIKSEDNNNAFVATTALKEKTSLIKFIEYRKEEDVILAETYGKVNDFVRTYGGIFKQDAFASQWGNIRSIAMKYSTKDELKRVLFGDDELSSDKHAYLKHGVAKEKWEKSGRIILFKKFFDKELNDNNAQLALVNLSSEMAKICRREK